MRGLPRSPNGDEAESGGWRGPTAPTSREDWGKRKGDTKNGQANGDLPPAAPEPAQDPLGGLCPSGAVWGVSNSQTCPRRATQPDPEAFPHRTTSCRAIAHPRQRREPPVGHEALGMSRPGAASGRPGDGNTARRARPPPSVLQRTCASPKRMCVVRRACLEALRAQQFRSFSFRRVCGAADGAQATAPQERRTTLCHDQPCLADKEGQRQLDTVEVQAAELEVQEGE